MRWQSRRLSGTVWTTNRMCPVGYGACPWLWLFAPMTGSQVGMIATSAT